MVDTVAGVLLIIISGSTVAEYNWQMQTWLGTIMPMSSGGILGEAIANTTLSTLGNTGANMLLIAIFLFGLTIFMDIAWVNVCERLVKKLCNSLILQSIATNNGQVTSGTKKAARNCYGTQTESRQKRQIIAERPARSNNASRRCRAHQCACRAAKAKSLY